MLMLMIMFTHNIYIYIYRIIFIHLINKNLSIKGPLCHFLIVYRRWIVSRNCAHPTGKRPNNDISVCRLSTFLNAKCTSCRFLTDPSRSKQFRGHDYSDASVTNVVKGLANSQPAVYNLSNAEKCISVFRAKYTILITATMSKAEILFGVQKSVLTEKGEKRSKKILSCI